MAQNDTAKIYKFFDLKCAGFTDGQAAKELKIERRTAQRWKQTAEYKKLARELKAEIREKAYTTFLKINVLAHDVIDSAIKSKDLKTQLEVIKGVARLSCFTFEEK